jgi:hypothetical protein
LELVLGSGIFEFHSGSGLRILGSCLGGIRSLGLINFWRLVTRLRVLHRSIWFEKER